MARGVAVSIVLVSAFGSASSGADPELSSATARLDLDAATQARRGAEKRLADLERRYADLSNRLGAASSERSAIANQLADAHRQAREQAVRAYVSGSAESQLAQVFDASGATDASLRTDMLVQSAGRATDAAAAFQRMKEENAPDVVRDGVRLDELAGEIDQARSDLDQATALEADAERVLADATAREAAVKALKAATATSTTVPAASSSKRAPAAVLVLDPAAPPPAVTPDGPGPERWARLRACESSGNYRAVSASGRYRGAYQFDQRTWEAVGGTGDPAAAAPAEQDQRARALYESRGPRAWPHCGVALR